MTSGFSEFSLFPSLSSHVFHTFTPMETDTYHYYNPFPSTSIRKRASLSDKIRVSDVDLLIISKDLRHEKLSKNQLSLRMFLNSFIK